MSILSGLIKEKRYKKTADGYKLTSQYTDSTTVNMPNGQTASTNLGAIKGITSSSTTTEAGWAADAASTNTRLNQLNSSLATTNTNLSGKASKSSDLGNCTFYRNGNDFYIRGADAVTKKLCSSTFTYIYLTGSTWDIGAAGRAAAQFNFKLNETKTLTFTVEGWFQSSFHTANYYYSATNITMLCEANAEYYIKTTSGYIRLVSIS